MNFTKRKDLPESWGMVDRHPRRSPQMHRAALAVALTLAAGHTRASVIRPGPATLSIAPPEAWTAPAFGRSAARPSVGNIETPVLSRDDAPDTTAARPATLVPCAVHSASNAAAWLSPPAG